MNKKEIQELCKVHDGLYKEIEKLEISIIGTKNAAMYRRALNTKNPLLAKSILPSLRKRFRMIPLDHCISEVMVRMINQMVKITE